MINKFIKEKEAIKEFEEFCEDDNTGLHFISSKGQKIITSFWLKKLDILLHQYNTLMKKEIEQWLKDEEDLLKLSSNGAEEVILNLRTRLSEVFKEE